MIIKTQFNFSFTIQEARYDFNVMAESKEEACEKLRKHLATIIYELNQHGETKPNSEKSDH